jgi:osmoprotectant transport system substrate-binding protein
MPELRALVRGACLALAAACAACATAGSLASPAAPGGPFAVITVGSFNFPESVLLAYLYADVLAARGYPVRVLPDLGTRELVDPALMADLIQLVPEYTGSALEFVSLGQVHATASVGTTAAALARSMAGRGLVTGRPAAAQDGNAIVVTAATAARYRLRTISDLARAAPRLAFGGPPECIERADCLPGLRLVYRVRFREFVPLDADGPLTRQALAAGDIGVALMFTSDPTIAAQHLVVLADNRGLQPAENVVPVVWRATVSRYGPGLLDVLNAVSARLSTAVLASLDAQVQLDGRAPQAVAATWLRTEGLVAAGPDGSGATP